MGHRKKSAPRRGSLTYLPKKRAKSIVARPNFWPKVEGDKAIPLGFVGYKAGMTRAFIVDDYPNSPFYGQEVCRAVTALDAPPLIACGLRAYVTNREGEKQSFTEVWAKKLPKDMKRKLTVPKKHDADALLKKIETNMDSISHLRLLMCTQPRLAAVPKKKPEVLEIELGGGTMKNRLEYAKKTLGNPIRISDVFSGGMVVDVLGVTKGKGFQGPVKRWGIKILPRKSRKTKRGVGAIGPWKPARMMYTVPRAGQMGFFKRTERNKKILKIGMDGKEITPKGGFTNYGTIKGDYAVLTGSIPGPAKRLIFIRYVKPKREPKAPKIVYMA